jgi:hypothetical protein
MNKPGLLLSGSIAHIIAIISRVRSLDLFVFLSTDSARARGSKNYTGKAALSREIIYNH